MSTHSRPRWHSQIPRPGESTLFEMDSHVGKGDNANQEKLEPHFTTGLHAPQVQSSQKGVNVSSPVASVAHPSIDPMQRWPAAQAQRQLLSVPRPVQFANPAEERGNSG